MVATFATQSSAKGWGVINRGQYSSPVVDESVEAAAHELDPKKGEALLRKAIDTSIHDVAWIPLLRPLNIEAMRAGLDHAPRSDGYIMAADVKMAK